MRAAISIDSLSLVTIFDYGLPKEYFDDTVVLVCFLLSPDGLKRT